MFNSSFMGNYRQDEFEVITIIYKREDGDNLPEAGQTLQLDNEHMTVSRLGTVLIEFLGSTCLKIPKFCPQHHISMTGKLLKSRQKLLSVKYLNAKALYN
ncbi:hypothetical protein Zmor_026702 [Zophobas morio]|uniref:Uncharacterized protein n=1 Tax=Zophobas morio TaxID=2755281 RepID=A0AA38HV36_9CUCU|nr:hypothetical protein Zmor_026702 [Zophobas morio]